MENHYQPQPSMWGGFQNQTSPQLQYSPPTCNHQTPSYGGQQTYSQQPVCAQSPQYNQLPQYDHHNQHEQATQQYAQSSAYTQRAQPMQYQQAQTMQQQQAQPTRHQQSQCMQHQQAQHMPHQQAQPVQPAQHTQTFQHSQNAQFGQQTSAQPGAEPKMPPEAEAILKSMKNGFACPRGCIPHEMQEKSMAPPRCPQTNNWNQRRSPQANNQHQNYHQNSYNSQSNIAQCNHAAPANFQSYQSPSPTGQYSSEYLPHLGHMKSPKENTMHDHAQLSYSQSNEPHFSTVQNAHGNTVQNLHEVCTNQWNYRGEGEGNMYGTRSKSENSFPIITGETTNEIQAVKKRSEKTDGLQGTGTRQRSGTNYSPRSWLIGPPSPRRTPSSRKSYI